MALLDVRQVAQHFITRGCVAAQSSRTVEIAPHSAPTGSDVEQHFQAFGRHAVEPCIAAFKANSPYAAQGVGQLLAGLVRQLYRRFTGRNGLVRLRQLAVGVIGRRHRSTGECQARDETSSRNRHCPTCVSPGAGFIQARTSTVTGNLGG